MGERPGELFFDRGERQASQAQPPRINITWSDAYSLFRLCTGQRDLSLSHVADLRDKMRKHGFLPDHAITCYREDGHIYITDGQHRFEAAKAEGISIPVLVLPKAEAILRLELNNTTTKVWSVGDSLNYYVKNRNSHYMLVAVFMEKYNLPHTATLRLVAGSFRSETKRLLVDFRSGAFKANSETLHLAHAMAANMNELRMLHPTYETFRADRTFIRALFILMSDKGYEHFRMMHQTRKHTTMLVRCVSIQAYIKLFETIYNYGRSGKKVRFEVPSRHED